MSDEYRSIPCKDLAPEQKHCAAELIYSALPEFYDLLPLSCDDRVAAIIHCVESEKSDLSPSKALCNSQEVVGVYTALPSSQLSAAQMKSLTMFLSTCPGDKKAAFLDAVKSFSATIPPVDSGSFYLARLAITQAFQGTGAASSLLQHFIQDGQDFPSFTLHVRQDNTQAIRFYEKSGFHFLGLPGQVYRIMAYRPGG